MVLEKTLESPLDCKAIQPVRSKGDQSWAGCSLEGLMLKLKLQYFGYLMRRADSFGKTLILGKIEGRRRRGCTAIFDEFFAKRLSVPSFALLKEIAQNPLTHLYKLALSRQNAYIGA